MPEIQSCHQSSQQVPRKWLPRQVQSADSCGKLARRSSGACFQRSVQAPRSARHPPGFRRDFVRPLSELCWLSSTSTAPPCSQRSASDPSGRHTRPRSPRHRRRARTAMGHSCEALSATRRRIEAEVRSIPITPSKLAPERGGKTYGFPSQRSFQ